MAVFISILAVLVGASCLFLLMSADIKENWARRKGKPQPAVTEENKADR
jgi:hypothetical protein